jgi:hypothetical protein
MVHADYVIEVSGQRLLLSAGLRRKRRTTAMTTQADFNRDGYRDLLQADIAQGSDIMGAKQTRRARSRFTPIDTLLTEPDRREVADTAAA